MFAAFSQTLVQACTHTRTYIWCVADSCLYLYVKHAQTPALLSLRLVWASHEIKVSVLFLSSLFSLSLHFDIYFLFYMYACKHVSIRIKVGGMQILRWLVMALLLTYTKSVTTTII